MTAECRKLLEDSLFAVVTMASSMLVVMFPFKLVKRDCMNEGAWFFVHMLSILSMPAHQAPAK